MFDGWRSPGLRSLGDVSRTALCIIQKKGAYIPSFRIERTNMTSSLYHRSWMDGRVGSFFLFSFVEKTLVDMGLPCADVAVG